MNILLASNNRHKAAELERIFDKHKILLPEDVGGAFDFEEIGTTFLENAFGKAMACFRIADVPVVADDSGLCVDALGGLPGIQSARFGASNGRNLESTERNSLLISRLKGVAERSARFVCCLVFVLAENRFFIAQETCEGRIVDNPKGVGGFGYDPIFFIPEKGMTMAELSDSEKDVVSHRGRAARQLLRIVDTI
jgi:XTP/dITP diphosphohydrolase